VKGRKKIVLSVLIMHSTLSYFIRPKLYDVLGILHTLRNAINFVWEKDIMSCFTKLSLINDIER